MAILSHARQKLSSRSQPAAHEAPGPSRMTSAEYWTQHNVTLHKIFNSCEESLEYFDWRNDQYPGTAENMPVAGHDGKVILDYGCGPGHDLVGFGTYSKPKRLVGMEVSPTSLEESRHRLALHGIEAELILCDGSVERLPFDDQSVDYIHSMGVLHHIENPLPVLQEFHRILKPGGTIRMMMYNRDSLWMHLIVAYHRRVLKPEYASLPLDEVFRRSTDGDDCPVSRCYRASDWIAECGRAGLDCTLQGTSISMYEMLLSPTRFEAIMNPQLPAESRKFLLSLEWDRQGYPIVPSTGHYAGIGIFFNARRSE